MTWLSDSIIPLRVLINDMTSGTYTDATLTTILLTSAMYVDQEVNLSIDYAVDFTLQSVTPDPSTDQDFINFTVLKAACLVNNNKYIDKINVEGIRARCGPAELQITAGRTTLLALLNEGPCKTYENLKDSFNFGHSNEVRGILSPFTSNNYIPSESYGDFR